jgi:ribosomal protein S18 acetylase RimI-like enzyme
MDMLIRLYALPTDAQDPAAATASTAGLRLRKPLGCEHDAIVAWVQRTFGPGWASEARAALANRPVTLQAALDPVRGLLGFCCHDATARGLVGPIGVAAEARGRGIGRALLRACLADMRSAGYAYAVVGAVGVPAFFHQVAWATPIEGSEPGLYAGMLR